MFHGFIEYFGAKRNVRKGQPLTNQAKLFGYKISIFTGSMLRGFGEMGSCMLLAYIASDWYLYPNKFNNNTLMPYLVFGIYSFVMMIVFPSFGKEKDKLISNRAMTEIGVLIFMIIMISIDLYGYFTLNDKQKLKLKWFFIYESLLIFQWNMFGYFISKKRYIAIDDKGTECKSAVISVLLLIYDSIVEMAMIISPFVVITLKTIKL